MRTNRVISLLIAAGLIGGLTSTAMAIGFPSMPSSTPASTSGGNADAMQSALVTHFVAGESGVISAQSNMAKAVGLNELATKLSTEGDALSKGATQDSVSNAMATSSDAQQQIDQALSQSKQMSSESKKALGDAIGGYALGLVALRKLAPDYKNYIAAANQEISAAGPMSAVQTKNKLQVGLFIATNTPDYLVKLTQASADLLKFATTNGVSVPKDATAALTAP